MCMYVLTVSTIEPTNIKEAMLDHSWIESMQDEHNQFKRLDVWELVERPVEWNVIKVKWIWKKKTDAKNTVIRNKSRLVTKGYSEQEGIDFELLKEEVFVSQPDGFVDPDFPNHVYHLKKAVYGLKQAPRACYDKLSSFLIDYHLTKGIVDPTLFTRRHGDGILLVQIYVDDIIFCSTNPVFSNRYAKLMIDNFEMSMMGEMKFFLGLQVHQFPRGVFINQSQYTLEILKKHGMHGCDSISTLMADARIDANLQGAPTDHTKYRSMIGGLMYLTISRPDISFSTFLVNWPSKKQDCTAMSTAEAEYVSLFACCAQVIWMRTQLLDYGYRYTKIPMYCDSKSAIAISCNPVQHSRTKHINIRYNFVKEHVEQGTIELYFVRTEYQLADLFTKALPKERFKYLIHMIGMRCMTPTELERFAKLSS
ncbi:retrovirus-related pol polyprotein from transposon TNT 1-94 [Tanacetum coccineum]